MLEGLRVEDPRMNAAAAELCARLPVGAVRSLVAEASHRKNRPRHRVRLLEVIGRIAARDPAGFDAEPELFFDVANLAHDRNADVRAAASRLIRDLPLYRAGVLPGIRTP
jgi:hypothetical protein